MENKNPEDIDLFIDIVNENNAKKQQQEKEKQKKLEELEQIFKEALNKSTTDAVIDYAPKPTDKPQEIKNIMKKALIMLIASILITIDTINTVKFFKKEIEINNINNTLGAVVKDNTEYYNYNDEKHEMYWEYLFGSMAKQILSTNLEYDIDTRIYCCYKKISDWQKNEHMNKLFKALCSIVNREEYDEKTKESCSFQSFDDYLNSLGLTEIEYKKFMDKVIDAYGNKDNDKVEELLNKLHGGSR